LEIYIPNLPNCQIKNLARVSQYITCKYHTLQEEDLSSPLVADTLNSVMACGELPTLYTNDEMEGLLQVSCIIEDIMMYM
jgi:hypothetical protein